MTRRLLLIAALLLAVFAAPLAFADEMAQTFQGKDTDGGDFSLDPYLGKVPILLDFGSIYCSSCIKSIPNLVVLQNEYKGKLKVVGVNLDTYGIDRVKRFFAAFKGTLNFPIVIDNKLKISNAYKVATLPTYILIDKTGKIVSTVVGYDQETKNKMERLVKKLVDGVEIAADEQVVKQNVTLLSPDNFTKTLQEAMMVIGTTGGIDGPITVRLNGGSEIRAKVKGSMYSARIPLSLGSNFIEVRYPKQDGFGVLAVVVFRDPRMGEGLGVNFPFYEFHIPEREARCVECHKMTVDMIRDAKGNLVATDYCAGCHGYQIHVKYVHGPITVGGCSSCHLMDSKPHKYEVDAKGTDLCFSCHYDVLAKFQRSFVHGPVAMGLCVACHSPHGSDFKFQLRHQQVSMCIGCHEDSRDKMAKFRPHKPVAEDKCTACHDPHSSDTPTAFLKGEGAELCFNCHDRKKFATHSHKSSGDPVRMVEGMKLDKAGKMNCQTCHDPHSSDESKLFTIKGGCDGCHKI